MPGRDLPPDDSPFWRFSLAVYALPGVAQVCLDLQDRRGADVNLLLWALYAGAAGYGRLDAAALTAAEAATAPLAATVLRPLRAVRRALKQRVRGMPADRAESFRQRLLALELEAERQQQHTLEGLLAQYSQSEDRVADAAANLSLFLSKLSEPDAETDRLATQLLIQATRQTVDQVGLN